MPSRAFSCRSVLLHAHIYPYALYHSCCQDYLPEKLRELSPRYTQTHALKKLFADLRGVFKSGLTTEEFSRQRRCVSSAVSISRLSAEGLAVCICQNGVRGSNRRLVVQKQLDSNSKGTNSGTHRDRGASISNHPLRLHTVQELPDVVIPSVA